jgi:transporter family protein
MDYFKDWRFLILLYIVCAGIWGVVQKCASMKLNTMTLSFVSVMSGAIVVSIASIKELQFGSLKGVLIASFGGVLGGIAAIAFYGALRKAPASIVIPLSSLSLVITVVLSYFFLREVIEIRHIAGIVLAILAIFLLTS